MATTSFREMAGRALSIVILLLAVPALAALAAAAACMDLGTLIQQSEGTVVGLGHEACVQVLEKPLQRLTKPIVMRDLTWDSQFSVNLLVSDANITLTNVVLRRALLYPLTSPRALLPAALSVRTAQAIISISNSMVLTERVLLTELQSQLQTTPLPGVTQGVSSIYIHSFNSSTLSLSNVTVTWEEADQAPVALATASTGSDITAALSAFSELDRPGNITLLNHITLAGETATWPQAGFSTQSVNLIGTMIPGSRMVLDLAGVPAFLKVASGERVRFYNLQVQGACMIRVPLVPRLNLSLLSVGDLWPIYSGDGGPSGGRTAKLLELYNVTTLLTRQELNAGMYWLHITSANFPQLYATGLKGIGNINTAIALPDITLINVNLTTIQYGASTSASVVLSNTTESSVLPVVVSQPGFDATTVTDCGPPRQKLPLSDPLLNPTPNLMPLFQVHAAQPIVPALVNATAYINRMVSLGMEPQPPLLLLMSNITMPASASTGLILLQRDLLIYSPAVLPATPAPGNPTSTTLNLAQTDYVIRIAESNVSFAIYISRVTLTGLAAHPLSAVSRGSLDGVNMSEPAYALPLWFVRPRDVRTDVASQVYLTQVTLVLPNDEWKQLYYAAVRGSNWRGGMGASQPLIQALTAFSPGAFGASAAGVHLATLCGWAINATNLWLVPRSPVSPSELQQEPAGMPGQAPVPVMLTASSSEENSKTGVIVGAVVGAVGGVLLLGLVAAFAIIHVRKKRSAQYLDAAEKAASSGTDTLDAANSIHSKRDVYGPRKDSAPGRTGTGSTSAWVGSHHSSVAGTPQSEPLPYHVGVACDGGPAGNSSPMHATPPPLGRGTPAALAVAAAAHAASQQGRHSASVPDTANTTTGPSVASVTFQRQSGPPCVNQSSVPPSAKGSASRLRPSKSNEYPSGEISSIVTLRDIGRIDKAGPDSPSAGSSRHRHPHQASAILNAMAEAMRTAGSSSNGPASGNNNTVKLEASAGSLDQGGSESSKLAGVPSVDRSPGPQHGLHSLRMISRSAPRGAAAVGAAAEAGAAPNPLYPISSDSETQQPWDPKKQVAALAQEMQTDGDKLQLFESIGQGGFGAVYRGRWRGLEVAIKTVLFSEAGGLGAQQRAIMEAAVCSSVMHPNVVATYHYDIMPMGHTAGARGAMVGVGGLQVEDMTRGQSGQAPADWKLFLVQEYCHASLYSVLTSKLMHVNGWPDMDLLLTCLLDIATGMRYLHSKNVLHGDLKPENVLLKNEAGAAIGVVSKITDFGLSTRLDPTASHISNITNGTPFYAAPEVINRGQINKSSDVYSFGVLMWEMFLATPPWVSTKEGYQLNAMFPTLPPATPAPYTRLTQQCLNLDHRNRPDFPTIIAELTTMHLAFLDGCDSLVPAPISQGQPQYPPQEVVPLQSDLTSPPTLSSFAQLTSPPGPEGTALHAATAAGNAPQQTAGAHNTATAGSPANGRSSQVERNAGVHSTVRSHNKVQFNAADA